MSLLLFSTVLFLKNHTFKILSISKFISKMFLKLATRSKSSQTFYLQNRVYIGAKFQTRSSVVCFCVLKIVCNTALHQSNAQIHGNMGDSFQSQGCERGRMSLQVEFPISNFSLTSRPVADIHHCCPAIRRVQQGAR